jgi:hypothetical protein
MSLDLVQIVNLVGVLVCQPRNDVVLDVVLRTDLGCLLILLEADGDS